MIKFMSTEQAAKELGVSSRRIRQMIESGLLKADKLDGGRAWIIHADDVRRMKAERGEEG